MSKAMETVRYAKALPLGGYSERRGTGDVGGVYDTGSRRMRCDILPALNGRRSLRCCSMLWFP